MPPLTMDVLEQRIDSFEDYTEYYIPDKSLSPILFIVETMLIMMPTTNLSLFITIRMMNSILLSSPVYLTVFVCTNNNSTVFINT